MPKMRKQNHVWIIGAKKDVQEVASETYLFARFHLNCTTRLRDDSIERKYKNLAIFSTLGAFADGRYCDLGSWLFKAENDLFCQSYVISAKGG